MLESTYFMILLFESLLQLLDYSGSLLSFCLVLFFCFNMPLYLLFRLFVLSGSVYELDLFDGLIVDNPLVHSNDHACLFVNFLIQDSDLLLLLMQYILQLSDLVLLRNPKSERPDGGKSAFSRVWLTMSSDGRLTTGATGEMLGIIESFLRPSTCILQSMNL